MATVDLTPRIIAYLQKVSLFKALSPEDLAAAAGAARQVALAEDSFLFHQGDLAETCYVLTHGRVRLSQATLDGQQVIVRFINPGDSFAFGATLSHITYPLSAEAVKPSRALAWSGTVMAQLMERYPRLALNAVELLVEQIHELQDRFRELATERVERRVARALLRLGRQAGRKTADGVLIDMDLSRQDLAEMTGTTLYTVSRVLSRWEEKGLVDSGRERVLIRFPHGLVAIAEDLPPRPGPDTEE